MYLRCSVAYSIPGLCQKVYGNSSVYVYVIRQQDTVSSVVQCSAVQCNAMQCSALYHLIQHSYKDGRLKDDYYVLTVYGKTLEYYQQLLRSESSPLGCIGSSCRCHPHLSSCQYECYTVISQIMNNESEGGLGIRVWYTQLSYTIMCDTVLYGKAWYLSIVGYSHELNIT